MSVPNRREPRPVREEGAERVLGEAEDPVTKKLMMLCVAEARMRFMRGKGQSEEDWRRQLPVADFDMEFFARVLERVCSHHDVLKRVLSGDSIAAATGWDDDSQG